jgi:hypothetical protein
MNDNQRAAIYIVDKGLRGRGLRLGPGLMEGNDTLDEKFLAENPWSTTENLLAEFALGLWTGERRKVHLRFASTLLDGRQWRVLMEALAIARGPDARGGGSRWALFTKDELRALFHGLDTGTSAGNDASEKLARELQHAIAYRPEGR